MSFFTFPNGSEELHHLLRCEVGAVLGQTFGGDACGQAVAEQPNGDGDEEIRTLCGADFYDHGLLHKDADLVAFSGFHLHQIAHAAQPDQLQDLLHVNAIQGFISVDLGHLHADLHGDPEQFVTGEIVSAAGLIMFALADHGWALVGLEAVGVNLEDVFVRIMDSDLKNKARRKA